MGARGSGRRRSSHLTTECLSIDTTFLKKHGYLTGDKLKTGGTLTFTVSHQGFEKKRYIREPKPQEQKHNMAFIAERYAPGQAGEFQRWEGVGHIELFYTATCGDDPPQNCHHEIPLVVTHPHYGGDRYWFLSPCCGERVRVLYLPIYDASALDRPACRECLNLNYSSQRQSYIERHKTYEKYLLSQYGYTWAMWEYNDLKEHYLEVTPYWEWVRETSVLKRELEMMRLLISCQRMMLKTDIHNLTSLKSKEDRLAYLDHCEKQHGPGYTQDLIRYINIAAKNKGDVKSQEDFEQAYIQEMQEDEAEPTSPGKMFDMPLLIARKRDVEQQLRELTHVA